MNHGKQGFPHGLGSTGFRGIQFLVPRAVFFSLFAFPLSLVLTSCEREIITGEIDEVVAGYEVRGHVYDRLLNPMRNVAVSVDYSFSLVDADDPPAETYDVPAPGEFVTVIVTRRNGSVFRSYPPIDAPQGVFSFRWDQRDAGGSFAPPGVYFVRYTVGPIVRLQYPVTVSGTRVALTDSLGRYTITNEHLPIDFYPVPLYSADGTRYYGNARVSNPVYVTFSSSFGPVTSQLTLVKDRVVEYDVTIN